MLSQNESKRTIGFAGDNCNGGTKLARDSTSLQGDL
jgi:hypothetical protein